MNRYLGKKRIIIAVLVILLCFVSITGATLAIFTSDLEDGKIGINATSGNLKVDIIDLSEKPQSLVGEVLDFVTTSEHKEAIFEPGSTFYTEGFRIKNIGDIPLNFIIYISEDKVTDISEDKTQLAAKFADAFDVWITPDPKSGEEMVKLQEFGGRLEAGDATDVYHLVFRMKKSAGNEFQNKAYSGVGITVCAVQGNVNID